VFYKKNGTNTFVEVRNGSSYPGSIYTHNVADQCGDYYLEELSCGQWRTSNMVNHMEEPEVVYCFTLNPSWEGGNGAANNLVLRLADVPGCTPLPNNAIITVTIQGVNPGPMTIVDFASNFRTGLYRSIFEPCKNITITAVSDWGGLDAGGCPIVYGMAPRNIRTPVKNLNLNRLGALLECTDAEAIALKWFLNANTLNNIRDKSAIIRVMAVKVNGTGALQGTEQPLNALSIPIPSPVSSGEFETIVTADHLRAAGLLTANEDLFSYSWRFRIRITSRATTDPASAACGASFSNVHFRYRMADFNIAVTCPGNLTGRVSIVALSETEPSEAEKAIAWESIQVYPNPSNGEFNLRVPADLLGEEAKVAIYNSQGQLVQEVPFANGRIVLDQQPAGLYLMKVANGDAVLKTFKLVVE
jgi:hypothetical protein